MSDEEDGLSRLDRLAGRDKTSERYIYYIGMGIALVLLSIVLIMVILQP